jgi:hypothetical protein
VIIVLVRASDVEAIFLQANPQVRSTLGALAAKAPLKIANIFMRECALIIKICGKKRNMCCTRAKKKKSDKESANWIFSREHKFFLYYIFRNE